MSVAHDSWLDAIARITGWGAVVLDGKGTPLEAEAAALAQLGCSSLEELREKWPPLQSSEDGVTPVGGSHAIAGLGEIRFKLVALSGADGERLVLLAPPGSPEQGEAVFAFARKLGHDLRGPLNAMVLNLDLLRTYLDMDIEEEERLTKLRRYMTSLHREIGRLNELLTAALDRARA